LATRKKKKDVDEAIALGGRRSGGKRKRKGSAPVQTEKGKS